MKTYKEALDEVYEHAGSAVGDLIREHVDDLYRQVAKAVRDGSTFHDGFKCGSETEKRRSAEALRAQGAEYERVIAELRQEAEGNRRELAMLEKSASEARDGLDGLRAQVTPLREELASSRRSGAELSKEAHRLREQRAEIQCQVQELRTREKHLTEENRDLRQSLEKSIEAETAYQKGWDDAVAAAHAPFDVRGIGNDSMDIGTRLRVALKEDVRHLGPIGHIGLPGISKVLRNVAGGRPTSQQEARAAMAEVLTVEEPERFAAAPLRVRDEHQRQHHPEHPTAGDVAAHMRRTHATWAAAVTSAMDEKDWEGLRQLRSIGPLLITSADATS